MSIAEAAAEVAEAVIEAKEVEQAVTDAVAEPNVDAVMEEVTVTKTVDPSGAAVETTVTETTAPSGETVTVAEVKQTEAPAETPSETPAAGSEAPAEAATEVQAEDPANADAEAAPLDPKDPRNLPPHGTEVFIGGIPKTATEAEIRDFAAKIGEVHSVKMSYDPNNPGNHRGYGFVRYLTKEKAEEAKQKLNNTKLGETESLLRVADSQSKHKLYIGNMPRAWTKSQVMADLNKSTKGLQDIELVMLRDNPGQSRGFGFATFYNHECATAAKNVLSKNYTMDGRTLTVSFAEPRISEQQPAVVKSRAVYVGGLPPGVTEEKLKELFGKYGEVQRVVIPPVTERRPEQKFCFVHYLTQESADAAVAAKDSDDKPILDDKTLEVKSAKPQENRLELRQQFDPSGRGGRGGRYGGPAIRGGRAMRGGRGPPGGRYGPPPAAYAPNAYDQGYAGYDQGYGGYQDPGYNAGYDPSYGAGYDQGYAGYDQYGGYTAAAAAPAPAAGMTMVPMMLASGQVGYVLQDQSGSQAAPQDPSYGGPDRSYGGRGRGQSRYRPY